MSGDIRDIADGTAYDIVVVGAGGAGMAAALFAAIDGQKVLLVERTEYVGGTTAFSGATTWIPNTQHKASVNGDDNPEKAAAFLRGVVGNHSSEALRDAFLRNGPAAIARLEAESDVHFRARPLHPDYVQEVEGATVRGRALEPLPFDGRKLGKDLALVRPPIPEFTVLGGMMVDRDDIPHLLNMKNSLKSFLHSMRIVGRYGIDRVRWGRGTRLLMGNALIGRLLYSLRKRGVDILVKTSVEELVRGKSGIEGLVVRDGTSDGGTRRRIAVRHGVIMATGGFTRHPKRRAELLPEAAVYSPTAPGATGEMQDLALDAGARFGTSGCDHAFWAPMSVRRRADGSQAVFPHFVLDRGKPGFVTVNKAGRRFVNEAASYHQFVQAMFRTNDDSPCIPTFLITDIEGLRKYGIGMVRPGGKGLKPFLDDGYLTEAPTLAELARKLDIDAAGLEDTVRRMNGFAASGVDPEFGRGTTAYHHVNGDAAHKPNPNLGAIGIAPFYAVRLYPGDIGASTGLMTDEHAQVLGPDDKPIGGLYACGNDMQSIMGGTYPGPGITIGPGITFAYIATRHAEIRTSTEEFARKEAIAANAFAGEIGQ
jgi:succinate dehydrogenase/fumarate reductase flavoprotein subunit